MIDLEFILERCFHKHVRKDGLVIYWRDCVLEKDMINGEQGYIWVFEDGSNIHSYQTPEMMES